jgi:hypothetical protein
VSSFVRKSQRPLLTTKATPQAVTYNTPQNHISEEPSSKVTFCSNFLRSVLKQVRERPKRTSQLLPLHKCQVSRWLTKYLLVLVSSSGYEVSTPTSNNQSNPSSRHFRHPSESQQRRIKFRGNLLSHFLRYVLKHVRERTKSSTLLAHLHRCQVSLRPKPHRRGLFILRP